MTIKIYEDVVQGSDEWRQQRIGLLTASEVKLILTPTLKLASNDKERAHVYELAAQRISGYVEPTYVGDEMLRGHDDEVRAKIAYAERFEPVDEVGFITNDALGFAMGYSPDALVGKHGLIECKSRRQKFAVQTMIEFVESQTIPDDYVLQVQSALLISGRKWCDFVSYTGGLPMIVIRVFPDAIVQNAIIEAATAFEARVQAKVNKWHEIVATYDRLVPTERHIEEEMF